MADKLVEDLIKHLSFLEGEHSQGWSAHWQDIGTFILPNRFISASAGQKPNRGETKNSSILDNTAKRALGIMASGMHGGLTSPSRPWFRLVPVDHDLNEYGPVRTYLDDCERVVYKYMSGSNFYTSIHNIYYDLIGFGTGLMYCLEDDDKAFRFRVGTIGTYYLSEGVSGTVDTVYRRYHMTARQVLERFGTASHAVERMAKDSPYDWVEVVHVIRPRKQRDSRKQDNANMAFESVYFEHGADRTLLRKSGYNEMPFMATRWEAAGGDVYGRGPGMDILPDVKMLQEMQRTYLMALHKSVNPPMQVPERLKGTLSLVPGSINVTAANEIIKPIIDIRVDLGAADNKIQQTKQEIKEGLFNDVFLMILDRPNMTATEVIQRNEEKMIMLGPVIERQFYELLNPCLDRVWAILARKGLLPEPPDEAKGQELRVEYISLLAQAQKAVGTKSIERILTVVGSMAEMHPQVLDKIDADEIVDQYGEMMNVPSGIIRADDRVSAIRDERAKAQQEQEEMARQAQEQQQINEGAKAMQAMGNTPVGDGTALDLVQ